MKGPTLRDRWMDCTATKPIVLLDICCGHWIACCDDREVHTEGRSWQARLPTHAEALAAAYAHAMGHLGEDMARWADEGLLDELRREGQQ